MPYIGRRMSVNAKKAHDRGLLTISKIRRKELDECGFLYKIDFFKWLCRNGYFAPSEFHHTGAARRMTRFYSKEKISRFAQNANLQYLYQIYSGAMTVQEALEKLNLKYYKIEVAGAVIGLKRVRSVQMCVIYYNRAFYFSVGQKILEKNINQGELRILDIFDKGDSGWHNKNRKAIERNILIYGSKRGTLGVQHETGIEI